MRGLDGRIAAVEARIKTAVAESKTSLLELFGVGPVLAAKLLGEVGDIRRFPSKHHFPAHTGTAPLEASSGQAVPSGNARLSRFGCDAAAVASHLSWSITVVPPGCCLIQSGLFQPEVIAPAEEQAGGVRAMHARDAESPCESLPKAGGDLRRQPRDAVGG